MLAMFAGCFLQKPRRRSDKLTTPQADGVCLGLARPVSVKRANSNVYFDSGLDINHLKYSPNVGYYNLEDGIDIEPLAHD